MNRPKTKLDRREKDAESVEEPFSLENVTTYNTRSEMIDDLRRSMEKITPKSSKEKRPVQRRLAKSDVGLDRDDRREELHMAARRAVKKKDFFAARDLWLELLKQFPADLYAHLALSKYFENKEKNYTAAIKHAKAATELELDEGTTRRIARIKRKMAKLADNSKN